MGFIKRLSQAFRRKVEKITEDDKDQVWIKNHTKLLMHLFRSHLVENALNVGDKVPISELQTVLGESLNLTELLKKGPVVLKFHRGTWCPYCVTDLEFFDKFSTTLTEQGAFPITISTQLAWKTREALEERKYKFAMVSDANTEISKKFGVCFTIPEEVVKMYLERFGFDLPTMYEEPISLSLPATYVIDQNGFITYAFLEEDFRNRASIEEITRFVKKCKVDRWSYYMRCEKEDVSLAEFSKIFTSRHHSPKSGIKHLQHEHHKSSSRFSFGNRRKSTSSVDSTGSGDLRDPLLFTLQSDEFLASFKIYLSKTYCTENLLFYLESTRFREEFPNLSDDDKKKEATRIIDTFIRVGADLEVNIDETTHDRIMATFESGEITSHLFEAGTKEIFKLMESDSFNKWRKTREFSTLWKRNGSLEFLAPVPTFAAEAA